MSPKSNILPKNKAEAAVMLFVIVAIPLTYWYELFRVIPNHYGPWSPGHKFYLIFGTFAAFNIIGNFLAIILTDTSIRGRMLSPHSDCKWRLCADCECLVPPRSWHCDDCKICILKRDHHCMFTSCCIGHFNHRYFLMFLLYVFVTVLLSLYYNVIFIYPYVDLPTWASLFKIIFPMIMVFVEFTWCQLFLFIVLLQLVIVLFSGLLLYQHWRLMMVGAVSWELKHNAVKYDYGTWCNVKNVLGDRWFLVWLSPFIRSDLIDDGINWSTKSTEKGK